MMSTLQKSINNGSKQLYASLGYSSLPFELLNATFLHCNRDDLKQCALTCRSWNAAARPIFFSSVELNSTAKIDSLISLVLKDNAIGACVKEVDALDMEFDLYLFSKIFKNIESITFDEYYNMYRSLYDLLSAGEFSSLKSIIGPMNVDQSEIYLKCVDIMKHRMTKIDIVGAKAYEFLQQNLHAFIKLKTINIEFYSSVPFSVINVFEDITQKNNLSSLKKIKVVILNDDSRFASNELIPRMNDIQPMPNVSVLNISGYTSYTIIDDAFMCYVIKKFPNLQRLKLLSYDNYYDGCYWYLPKEDNQIVLSVDVTVKFLEYVFKLSTFEVQHIATEEKTVEVIESFCSDVRKKALDNTPSLCICYDGQIEGDEEIEEDEEFDAISPVVSMKSAQPLQNLAPSITVGLNPFYDPIFNNGQAEQKLIQHTGQYFTKITLDNIPTFSFQVLLSNIAKYCVNLKDLVILNTSKLLEETIEWNNLVPNHSLTHLTVDLKKECPSNLLSFLSYLFVGLEMLTFSTTVRYMKLPERRFDLIVPKLSVKYLQVELPAYGNFLTEPISRFSFLVQLDIGEKLRYLLFSMLPTRRTFGNRFLKFDREISAFEFEESKKVDENYFIYHVQCKSAERVSIKYVVGKTTMDNFVYEIHQVHF